MSRVKLDEGDRGERLACEYLKTKGFDIIDRNFRLKGGEIDIVAIDPSTSHSTLRDEPIRLSSRPKPSGSDSKSSGPNGILVFVEVKTRTSYRFGTGFEVITPWKLKALVKSANFYKMVHTNLPDAMRIDAVIVMVDYNYNLKSIEHMENISV